MKDTIAYFCKSYLPLSQTFIYDALRSTDKFNVLILTGKIANLSSFPYPRDKIFVKTPFFPQRYFRKVLTAHSVKLVHAHWGRYGILLLPLCQRLKLPLITSFYGIDVSRHARHRFYLYRLRQLFDQGSAFIVLSNKMKQDILNLGCPEKKIFVHYQGVDINTFSFSKRPHLPDSLQAGKQRFDILLHGRFVEKKGLDYGIRAFKIIADKYPQAFLTIIGDGELRKKLQYLVKSIGLQDRVTFLGFRPHSEIPAILKTMDILLSPNVTSHNGDKEGIPTTIKEAMATGLPVVSTYHSGIPELVLDGKTGFLVPERDIDALAEKLENLITDQQLREEFGKNGAEVIKGHSDLFKQARKLEDIYQLIVKSNIKN